MNETRAANLLENLKNLLPHLKYKYFRITIIELKDMKSVFLLNIFR
jgi:hypothetical protein